MVETERERVVETERERGCRKVWGRERERERNRWWRRGWVVHPEGISHTDERAFVRRFIISLYH